MAQDDKAAPEAPGGEQQLQLLGTPTVNSPLDAASIFVDAVQGAMVAPGVTKVFFIEQIVPYGETAVKGRYVANLILPTDQLRALGQVLVKLADDTGH